MKRWFSLQGKFVFALIAILAFANTIAIWAALYLRDWLLAVLAGLVIAIFAAIALVKAYFRPIEEILQALRSGVMSFKDQDYSIKIAQTRDDELGHLVKVYNNLATTLRNERFALFQRELLLDTVIQNSSVAVVITNARGSVVFSNRVVRRLFGKHTALEGHMLIDLCEARSAALAEQTRSGRDGLFTVEENDESEVYHLTCRHFKLNAQPHYLYMYKQLTREIARQEVDTWKKVIRVISHELNNSLAPISSLTHSAKLIVTRGDKTEKLKEVFDSIAHRTEHLHHFIEQYARFARLPKPQLENVIWPEFISDLQSLSQFKLLGDELTGKVTFDPGQMEQVLINLLKNAHESGSKPDQVNLRIAVDKESILIAVEDRGPGMDETRMSQALLPFYSTKRSGTGLGLPLCREIIEAHGGHFRLVNRHEGGLAAICQLPAIHKD